MREKTARDLVVNRYIEFLKDVQCYDVFEHTELSELIAKHGINKSVRRALIDLAIIDLKDNAYWNYLSFEPNKPLALSVLNYLLERSKKSRATVIAGLEETNAVLRSLSETVNNYIQRRESVLKQTAMPSNGNLFSEVDSKQNMRVDIAKHIAGAVFGKSLPYIVNPGDSATIDETSRMIVTMTDSLISELSKKISN